MDHSHFNHYTGEQAFGHSCATLRQQMKLTQGELARLLAVSEQDVERWEQGVHFPTPEQLKRFTGLALQRHAFPLDIEREAAEQLWLSAGQLANFEVFWRLAQQTAAFAPPALLVLKKEAVQSRAWQVPPSTPSCFDWGEALEVYAWYGREQEMSRLSSWIVQERCQVVTVLGMGGIGKSALAVTLMRQIAPAFQAVVFRSVRDAPLCQDLLADCLQVFSPQPLLSLPTRVDQRIDVLLECLQTQSCLLVLDNLETLLQEHDSAGHMRPGYQDYATLLRRVAQTPHQSCLLLTSREFPTELEQLEGSQPGVRALRLGGLALDACEQLFDERELGGTTQERERLAQRYIGNPLALKIVAETIAELFGGEIGFFLKQDQVIFSSIRNLLAEHWTRLSTLEQALLIWMAIVREPLGAVELHALLVAPVAPVAEEQVREALQALHRRSLVEQGKQPATFTLQSVVLEYVTEVLVERVSQQVLYGVWKDLISYALVLAGAKEYVRQTQERMLVAPILVRLQALFRQADALEEQLLRLLNHVRTWDQETQGYGPANLIALLRVRRGHLRGLDLSQLALRGAYLQGVEMQDTNLSWSLIRESVLTETFDVITAVAISSSGNYWAAAGRRGEVRVWEWKKETGLILHLVWQAHIDATYALTFSPDGCMLVSGSWDDTIKLWDVASGALLWSSWHPNGIQSLAIAPDGGMLATGGNDATVKLWDLRSGRPLQTLPHPSPILSVAWSPDGHLLATGGFNGLIQLWEIHNPRTATCMGMLSGHTNRVLGLAFAPDGNTLASASWDGTVKLWKVASRGLHRTLVGHTDRVNRVVWSPDGRTLASGGRDTIIWLWDSEEGSYRAALQGHRASVNSLTFMPDNRSLLSGSDDGTLRLWDIASGQCMRVMQGYAASLFDVDWSPDSTQLVGAGSETLVILWDVASRVSPRVLYRHRGIVYAVGWSPDGRWLASSAWDDVISLWDTTTGILAQTLRDPDNPGNPDNIFRGVAWSPDGHLLASGTSLHGVQVWDITEHSLRWAGCHLSTRIRHLAWSPDGTRLAGGGDDGHVYLWDASDGALLQQLAGHQGVVTSVAWTPDSTRLVSAGRSRGSSGGELLVWDVQSGACMQAFAGQPDLVSAVTWDQSGAILVSGSSDGLLRWWEVHSGACFRVLQGHEGTIWALKRSPDGRWLASSGDDGAIRIWDLHRGEPVQTLRRDRPYERLNITGLRGVTEAQKANLRALGAIEENLANRP